MINLRILAAALALVSFSVFASTAGAARPDTATCTGGAIAPQTYSGLVVTGKCWFTGDSVTVNGNVTVAAGAALNDHAGAPDGSAPAHVLITGNVAVGKGGILGLGTYNPFAPHDTTVDGNITADQPLSLYLSFITVHGNVVSNGGGGGTTGEFRNFPTKDDTIDGNLIVQGWTGGWVGVIRDHVGGNVIFSKNTSVLSQDEEGNVTVGTDADSSEVVTNVIGGNLICQGNTPMAQIGDSGGLANVVGGNKLGQCSGL